MKLILLWMSSWLPPAFRSEFGAEVDEQIERDLDVALEHGVRAVMWFTATTAVDLAWAAAVERFNPTWTRGPGGSWKGNGGDGMMRDWIRDLYFAYRSLRRTPGFAVTAVGMLGLAIGVSAAIFSVVQKVLLDPLPYPDPDQLVFVAASAPGSDFPEEFPVAAEFYFDYRDQTDLLEDVGAFNSFTATLRVDDRVERVRMSVPTPSMFTTLGVTPILGRLPVIEDGQEVAVISHAAWLDWFGGDPSVIGQSYEVMSESRTVIGVMGPGFGFPTDGVLVWVPNDIRNEGLTPGRFGVSLVARLAPGVEMQTLVERLQVVASRFPEKYGGSANYARLMEQHRPVVRPLEQELVGFVAAPLKVLLGAVLMVLRIACANVTNLFLVRAERRQRDLAVRRAIGAGWAQLVRLQMAEAVLLATLAGGLAVLLAWIGLPLLVGATPAEVPRLGEVALSGPTLLFIFAACGFAGLVCGIPPALRAAGARTGTLRDGSRGATRRSHWGRDALVVLQTSLALVLLVGSGLLLRSFQELRRVDPGYDVEDVFTFQMAIEDEPGMDDAVSMARFNLNFMDQLRALPGVESVGIVENVPLNEGVGTADFITEDMLAEEDGGVQIGRTWSAGDYFETMGIALMRGRIFEDAEQLENPGSVIVSEAAAQLLWPGENPLGRRLQWPALGKWETVVGVVEDVMQNSLRDEVQPMVYFPFVGQDPEAWAFSSPAFVIKTGRAETIAPEVRAMVRREAPSAPMYRIYTLAGLASDSMVELSFTMLALGLASALAMLLGTVGLYGVLSFVVAERTREIGVRMALGAQADRVRRMVVAQGIRVVILGVGLGLVAAVGLTRSLRSLLFGVGAVDVTTFVVVSATMIVVGMVASYLPARRASNVDLVESLRAG
jgi:putative ABC transport system permease protein